MRHLPSYLDIRKRPDNKWDIWANLPDPILGRINVRTWQIVDVATGGRAAYDRAMELDRLWRTPTKS